VQVPGDIVLDLSEMTNQTIKIGAVLRQVNPHGGKRDPLSIVRFRD
jgi:hypothetical protein